MGGDNKECNKRKSVANDELSYSRGQNKQAAVKDATCGRWRRKGATGTAPSHYTLLVFHSAFTMFDVISMRVRFESGEYTTANTY